MAGPVGWKWAATAALLVVGASPVPISRLGTSWPDGLPALGGWQRITGELEVAEPHRLVQYEFFVNPQRQALYEVVRYRVTPLGGEDAAAVVTEKVQWHRGQRDLLRYECVPVGKEERGSARSRSATATDGCAWQEMAKDSEGYVRETGTLLWLYSLHRQVVLEREAPRR